MEKTNAKFEVGDWILLNDETLAKLSTISTGNAKTYIENYKFPRKVLSIIATPNSHLYVMGNTLKIREREFRLAIKKEIKEHELRSIFV
jgi:hypothetical protein